MYQAVYFAIFLNKGIFEPKYILRHQNEMQCEIRMQEESLKASSIYSHFYRPRIDAKKFSKSSQEKKFKKEHRRDFICFFLLQHLTFQSSS